MCQVNQYYLCIYIDFLIFDSVKKIFFYLVFLGIKNQRIRLPIRNIGCYIRKWFLSVNSFSQRLTHFERRCSRMLVLGWPACLKTSFIYARFVLDWCIFETVLNRKWFVFSSSSSLMGALLFIYKQKRVHLFRCVCSLFCTLF